MTFKAVASSVGELSIEPSAHQDAQKMEDAYIRGITSFKQYLQELPSEHRLSLIEVIKEQIS